MSKTKSVATFSKEECVTWLKEAGLSISGSKEELQIRINKYKRYPNLVNRLKSRASAQYNFFCSLDPIQIPPLTAKWNANQSLYPTVSNEMFMQYLQQKKEGSQGQQEKAYRMLQSRKIVSVKTLSDEGNVFVKAMIKKSYGNQSRPAVILFQQDIPKKGNCSCPVGLSGLCCHVLSLLLFLKHFSATGEKILELTCTQQLQKWHRRTKKGSIPMIPLKDIKLKSAKKKTSLLNAKNAISPADSDSSHFKRDLSRMIKELNQKLDLEKNIENHVYGVLSNSEIGKNSSLGQFLIYKNELKSAMSLADHKYVSQSLYDSSLITVDKNKEKEITKYITCNTTFLPETQETIVISNNIVIHQNELPLIIEKYVPVYANVNTNFIENIKSQINTNIKEITVDITYLEAPIPNSTNYINVAQNSKLWHSTRRFKITGSRLPALLGFYGKQKFNSYWNIVENGSQEDNLQNLTNIKRGQYYEHEALEYFKKISKSVPSTCGFFQHPTKKRFGASPDALGPCGILIEIKTRATDSDGPLKSLAHSPNYFIQCQLQMICTDASYCFLLSYHPESKIGTTFVICKDNVLMDAVIDLCESKLHNEKVLIWNHHEQKDLKNIGIKLTGKYVDFENLKPLRRYITQCCKSIPLVRFVDNFQLDFEKA